MSAPRMIHISSADRTVESDSDSSFTVALRPGLSGVTTLALMQATIPNTGFPFAANDSECIFFYEQSHPDDLMIATMPTNIQFWDLNMEATYFGQAMSAGVGAYDSSITAVNSYTCQFLPEANRLVLYTTNQGVNGYVILSSDQLQLLPEQLPNFPDLATRKLGFVRPFPGTTVSRHPVTRNLLLSVPDEAFVSSATGDSAPYISDPLVYVLCDQVGDGSLTSSGEASVLGVIPVQQNYFGWSTQVFTDLPHRAVEARSEDIAQMKFRLVNSFGELVSTNGVPVYLSLAVTY